jgi:hypothetical protein
VTNYWAQRLGQGQQQQVAPPPPAPSNRPWWQPGSVQPIQQPVQQVPVQQQTLEQQAIQRASVDPNGKVHIGDLLAQTEYTTTEQKAPSLRDKEPCPECGSSSYMGIPGQPNKMHRCMECGFNPRFQQMAAGINGAIKTQGPVRSARVQNPAVEGAPPMGAIVQHI